MSYWQLNNKRRTYAGNLVKLEEKGAVPGHWIIEFSSYPTGIWVIPFCILISVFQKNFWQNFDIWQILDKILIDFLSVYVIPV